MNRRALRTAECIVMLLGQVAVTVKEQHGVVSTVVAIFQQRLFHPVCSLDGNIVIELGKMAAKTGVWHLNWFKIFMYDLWLVITLELFLANYTIMHVSSCCKFDMDICLGKNRASRSGQECAYKALHSGQGLPFRFYSLAKNALVHNNSIKAACPAFLSVYTVSAYVYTLDLGSSIALWKCQLHKLL